MFFGIDLIQAIQAIGYPGIFAIVLAESGLFFAVYLPGGSMLFTAGLLASQGILNIWILLATVIIAATLGDTIGYWFGAWVGPALFRRKDSRFFKQKHLEQTREFFREHGAKTVFLARFVPIVRTFAPILAGVGEMRYHTFLFYNIMGAVLWGGGFTLAGYFLGEAIPDIEKYLEVIVLAIVVVTVLPLAHHIWRARKVKGGAKAQRRPLPRAIIFDLDDTLAPPYEFVSSRVGKKLAQLTHKLPVAIMSAASFKRIAEHALPDVLPEANADNLYIFSASTGQCFRYENNIWRNIYDHSFSEDERRLIVETVTRAIKAPGVLEDGWDERSEHFEDSGASITFVAPGLEMSPNKKRTWDPDKTKRQQLQKILQPLLPEYDILISGRTSIDIVKKSINKEYGVRWFAEMLGTEPKAMLFIGDAFYEGGNDAIVIPTGIQTHQTSGPEETETLIDQLLAA